MHDLFDELDAFNPKWRDVYPTVRSAAEAAEVMGLYVDWTHTPEGMAYKSAFADVPDYAAAAKAAAESVERFTEASNAKR